MIAAQMSVPHNATLNTNTVGATHNATLSTTPEGAPHSASLNTTTVRRRTVRFSVDELEDALDREMKHAAGDIAKCTQQSSAAKRGNWRVSDEQIEELIKRTAQANADELKSCTRLANAGKMMSTSSDAQLGFHRNKSSFGVEGQRSIASYGKGRGKQTS